MYAETSLGVVVPAYNEAAFIGEVIETIPDYVDGVYVVDDHSTDSTWEVIQTYVTNSAPDGAVESEASEQLLTTDGGGERANEFDLSVDVTAVRHQENRGRGAAVIAGYRLAQLADHDVVAVMDGDGQMDPAILHRIVEPVATGSADYAKGNRLVSRVHTWQMSRWRLFGNVLLTLLTRIASGQWQIRDPQNGYTAISAAALDELSLEDVYEGYGFLNDLLIRLDAHGMNIEDVPMEAVYGDESSGIRYQSFVPNLSFLLLYGTFWRLWMKYVANDDRGASRVVFGK